MIKFREIVERLDNDTDTLIALVAMSDSLTGRFVINARYEAEAMADLICLYGDRPVLEIAAEGDGDVRINLDMLVPQQARSLPDSLTPTPTATAGR